MAAGMQLHVGPVYEMHAPVLRSAYIDGVDVFFAPEVTELLYRFQVILLVGGEHARELITSEIVYWLGKLLSGIDEELADWAAIESATAAAWKRGWAKGTLKEWADSLLKRVLFKVRAGMHARRPIGMRPSSAHARSFACF